MKPTFPITGSYFGGKGAAGVVHRIINQIPYHQTFVSGFLGKCAIMKWKRPAARMIGFDLDAAVIAEWREAAGVEIKLFRADFIAFWPEELLYQDTFLYLDPPYLLSTRTSGPQYKHELTEADHRVLLTKAKKLPCMVAISCYDSDLYRQELAGWRKIQFPSQTRKGTRLETLYMNYPEPTPNQLHDPRFLGSGFRAREKGKRRIETVKNKITRLTLEEKARLLEWLDNLVTSQKTAILPATSQKAAMPAALAENCEVDRTA